MPTPDLPEPLRTVRDVLVFYANPSNHEAHGGGHRSHWVEDWGSKAAAALSALDAAQVEVWYALIEEEDNSIMVVPFGLADFDSPSMFDNEEMAKEWAAKLECEYRRVLVIFPAEEPDDG